MACQDCVSLIESGRKESVICTSDHHLHLYYKIVREVVLCSDYANSYHRRSSAPDDSQQPFSDCEHRHFNAARTKSVTVIMAVLLSA